jgi:hypothetical protein
MSGALLAELDGQVDQPLQVERYFRVRAGVELSLIARSGGARDPPRSWNVE